MLIDKTDQANASKQTNSYQGTLVKRWYPVVEEFEGEQGQVSEDEYVCDSHKEILEALKHFVDAPFVL